MATAQNRRKSKRRFVVLRDFQIRFSILLSLVGIFVTLIVGIVIYRVYDNNIAVIAEKGIVTSPAAIEFLVNLRSNFVKSLVAVFIGVTAILLIMGILLSHRMAGPIYALLRQMKLLSYGDFNASLLLRKGDEFQVVRDGYNDLVTSLQNRLKEDLLRLNQIKNELDERIAMLQRAGVPPNQLAQFGEIKDEVVRLFEEKNNLLNPKEERFTIDDVVI